MNIDDVKAPETTPEKIWPVIFTDQLNLELKYGTIEAANGFFFPEIKRIEEDGAVGIETSFPVDSARHQAWIKDKLWRFMEEIAESYEVVNDNLPRWEDHYDTDPEVRHALEEIADAIHFLVAVTAISGALTEDRIQEMWDDEKTKTTLWSCTQESIRTRMGRIAMAAGLVGNTLKNKPWKTTHMSTDLAAYHNRWEELWMELIHLLMDLRLGDHEVYGLYVKKNEVNQFRQRSNY